MRTSWFTSAIVATALLLAAPAGAYPTKPVRLVVPFPAGGAVDGVARVIANKLTERLGQPVVVENRPGVGGNLAADVVAKSAADGHTILITTNGQAISPALYKSLPYDPVKDLTPVTLLIESALLLVASPTLPAATLPELLALAKAKPGTLNYGSTGIGNPLHLTMEMLKQATGADIPMVTYRGDAPLIQALLGGEVPLAVVPIATGRAQVEEGRLRGLAVTTLQRAKELPNIPTVAEQGIPGFDFGSWQGFFVPAQTPKDVVMRIYSETKAALDAADVRERLRGFSAEPVGSTPEAFAARFKADVASYQEIVRTAKIPLQD